MPHPNKYCWRCKAYIRQPPPGWEPTCHVCGKSDRFGPWPPQPHDEVKDKIGPWLNDVKEGTPSPTDGGFPRGEQSGQRRQEGGGEASGSGGHGQRGESSRQEGRARSPKGKEKATSSDEEGSPVRGGRSASSRGERERSAGRSNDSGSGQASIGAYQPYKISGEGDSDSQESSVYEGESEDSSSASYMPEIRGRGSRRA